MNGPTYSICLDVGAEQDYSVFTILRRLQNMEPDPARDKDTIGLPHYGLVYLEQMPLKTRYPDVYERAEYIHKSVRGDCHFLVDATGVGNPVVQSLRHLSPIPIVIVSGLTVNARENGGYNVPKREIVTALQGVMHSRRLQIAKGLPHQEQLKKEILSFKMRPRDSGNIEYGAASERIHDDMVMSLAINIWYNERMYGYKMEADLLKQEEAYDPFEAYA